MEDREAEKQTLFQRTKYFCCLSLFCSFCTSSASFTRAIFTCSLNYTGDRIVGIRIIVEIRRFYSKTKEEINKRSNSTNAFVQGCMTNQNSVWGFCTKSTRVSKLLLWFFKWILRELIALLLLYLLGSYWLYFLSDEWRKWAYIYDFLLGDCIRDIQVLWVCVWV